MVRKLKFHEQKLLKKLDLISLDGENNLHEVKIMKKFYIQKREDYTLYKELSRKIRELARKIKELAGEDAYRIDFCSRLLQTLYDLGLISTKWDLSLCNKITASSFCRRRLPVIMVRNKMAENLKAATQFIEQGHVRVGSEIVKDPAMLVNRNFEDFITWVNTSSIRRHVMEYNGECDDYDLL